MELLRMTFPRKVLAVAAEVMFVSAEEIEFSQSLAGCKDIGLTWGVEQTIDKEWAFVVNVSD